MTELYGSGYVEKGEVGLLAITLAREAMFSNEIMAECTPPGTKNKKALPQKELYQIKLAIFQLFPNYQRNLRMYGEFATRQYSRLVGGKQEMQKRGYRSSHTTIRTHRICVHMYTCMYIVYVHVLQRISFYFSHVEFYMYIYIQRWGVIFDGLPLLGRRCRLPVSSTRRRNFTMPCLVATSPSWARACVIPDGERPWAWWTNARRFKYSEYGISLHAYIHVPTPWKSLYIVCEERNETKQNETEYILKRNETQQHDCQKWQTNWTLITVSQNDTERFWKRFFWRVLYLTVYYDSSIKPSNISHMYSPVIYIKELEIHWKWLFDRQLYIY